MAAAVLVSGPALHPLLQLVVQSDGTAGEGLEAHGDDGKARSNTHFVSRCLVSQSCVVVSRT